MKEFFTVEAHSKPKKLPLFLPNGDKSEHYIMVIGVDSTPAREAKAESIRAMVGGDTSKQDATNIWISGFIESWSFDEDCTKENKLKFLENAPSIAEKIDIFASNHNNFVKKQKR